MAINKHFIKSVIFFGCTTCGLQAVDSSAVPTPIIQNRPNAPRDLTSYDSELRKQMTDIDVKIQKLTENREALRAKVDNNSILLKSLQEQYQEQVNLQQNFQLQMQGIDDTITQLVRRKAEIAKQMRK